MSLDALLTSLHARTSAEKGPAFERLCRWFLRNDPKYALQVHKVWLFGEWPDRWGADTGTDLIVETVDGKTWAIQAKAYAPDQSVTKRGIDSFLSDTNRPGIDFRLLIATTNNIGANALKTMSAQRIPVGVVRLSDLRKSDAPWPISFETLKSARRVPKPKLDHQRVAIEKSVAGFAKHQRGQLIMACGSGKTLTALWLGEQMHVERTLVLLPSLSLLSQTLTEWAGNSSTPFAFLPVCSDATVGDKDQMTGSVSELGLPATTDPQVIRHFLAKPGRRVVFSTYQSSARIAEAFHGGNLPPFDLAIADEAHRCAGKVGDDFGKILDSEAIPARWRLFMTATPRLFTGRVKAIAKEADYEIASMDDEALFGPVFHQLNFSDAIRDGLLSDYQVVVIGVDDEMCRQYVEERRLVSAADGAIVTDARTLVAHIALAKAMKTYDLKRVISFHGRVKGARVFSEDFPRVVAWMPDALQPSGSIWTSHVSGEMPTGKRDALLDRFRELEENERGLMSNARCLSEGVDVPALDGVAFIDPRRSQVDIVQAVGRAIRKSASKEKGTIIIPVYLGENEDPEVVLDDSRFKPIWDICRALRAHDDILAEQLDVCRQALGREGARRELLPRKIVCDLPLRVSAEMAAAISLQIIEHATSQWDYCFGLLERFVDRTGNADVPRKHMEVVDGKSYKLGVWVHTQRKVRKRGILSSDRIAKLEQLGLEWTPQDAIFRNNIRALSQFVVREGHARVPRGHSECVDGKAYKLYNWTIKQRRDWKAGDLSAARIRALDDLSFEWNPAESAFMRGVKGLSQFSSREGHMYVPDGHIERVDGIEIKLKTWISQRRREHSEQRLEPSRIKTLTQLGLDLSPTKSATTRMVDALQLFVAREGHARVPSTHVENIGDETFYLGNWVSKQRAAWKRGSLSRNLIRELERLGFEFDPFEAKFQKGLAILFRFFEREGHANVPVNFVEVVEGESFKLGSWLAHRRYRWRKGTLSKDHVAKLEQLGLEPTPRTRLRDPNP